IFKHMGLNAIYRLIDIEPEQWDDFSTFALVLPLAGFNVTIPYKNRFLEGRSVNTVKRVEAGWAYYGTDGEGFWEDLRTRGCDLRNAKTVILGAGGSAQSIIETMLQKGLNPAQITVINRRDKPMASGAGLFLTTEAKDFISRGKEALAEATLLVN